jgi:hypothetical protein
MIKKKEKSVSQKPICKLGFHENNCPPITIAIPILKVKTGQI